MVGCWNTRSGPWIQALDTHHLHQTMNPFVVHHLTITLELLPNSTVTIVGMTSVNPIHLLHHALIVVR